jgi:hypothetical protein
MPTSDDERADRAALRARVRRMQQPTSQQPDPFRAFVEELAAHACHYRYGRPCQDTAAVETLWCCPCRARRLLEHQS